MPAPPGRSRKRRRVEVGDAVFAPREPRVRGEARNEQIRAGLEPLRPGERPLPLRIAVLLALAFGVVNLGLFAAGYDLRGGSDPSIAGVLVFSAIMLVAAAGMWLRRYWAVLGFECLLAVTCVYASASLMVASNVRAVVLCLAIVGLACWLFWKLVGVMARMQVPRRPANG